MQKQQIGFHTAPCMYCDGWLVFIDERGWCHDEGGTYMMDCPDCGYHGAPYPTPGLCPRCGSASLKDDHCGQPDHRKKEAVS